MKRDDMLVVISYSLLIMSFIFSVLIRTPVIGVIIFFIVLGIQIARIILMSHKGKQTSYMKQFIK